ncbi:MAG: hypothetical protein ACO3SP_11010 [Ilumatobacteraceae bacterium]
MTAKSERNRSPSATVVVVEDVVVEVAFAAFPVVGIGTDEGAVMIGSGTSI